MGCTHSSKDNSNQGVPRTLYVSASGGQYRTVSDAVANSHAGDRIVVAPGTYLEQNTIVIRHPLDIGALHLCSEDKISQNRDNDSFVEGMINRRNMTRSKSDMPKILGQRSRLIFVDMSGQPAFSCGKAFVRGLQLASGTNDQPVVRVQHGCLLLDSCEITGGQDCISVDGPRSYCDVFDCILRGSAYTAVTYSNSARGLLRNTMMTNNPTGVIISNFADPSFCECTITECGTGVLCRDEGNGMFTQCVIERNRKPGVIVSGKSNPMMRSCRICKGDSNGVFVRDEGRGSFIDCDISGNGLPAVATCNESYPILCHCTITEGRNAGILIYDNGSGIISKCIIHDNQMPGIEVRAGGHPVVASCEIFKHKSNGVYVHKRGRGVFHGCRIYENDLPGIAIRTGGNPLVHGCSVVTGKDSALMVCDKGKGIVLESVLKGYSTRPLEVRDDCNLFMEFCELHDGKHRHILDWLEQAPKKVSDEQIRILGWTDEQLAEEDRVVEETSADLL